MVSVHTKPPFKFTNITTLDSYHASLVSVSVDLFGFYVIDVYFSQPFQPEAFTGNFFLIVILLRLGRILLSLFNRHVNQSLYFRESLSLKTGNWCLEIHRHNRKYLVEYKERFLSLCRCEKEPVICDNVVIHQARRHLCSTSILIK